MGTKTIKISEDVYNELLMLKETNIKETLGEVIERISYRYDPLKISLKSDNGAFYTEISGRKRTVPTFSPRTKIVRIDDDLHSILTRGKIHPEESFNFELFRFISYHYANKPVYRIFTGNRCGNCDSLKRFIQSTLLKIPEIEDGIVFSFLDCDRRDLIRYIIHELGGSFKLPSSILYDGNRVRVWGNSGYHAHEEVQKQIEQVLGLPSN